MKNHIQNLFLLPALIAGLGLILTGRATAQTFTNLYNFSVDFEFFNGNVSNSDGYGPNGSLILSGNTLYGTASQGGSWGSGTVFAVNTDGSDFTNLHSFTAASGSYPNYTNSDGNNPSAGLILAGNTLYGTASSGGTNGNGTVFAISTSGAVFTNLHSFSAEATNSLGRHTNSDGYNPVAGLVLSGNTLYGTASAGGTNGCGTVFAINTNGTGFTNLHSFTATSGSLLTNSDGATPVAGLILSGNTLYGTASSGGTNGNGTVFAVNTNGTGFTVLHTFAATTVPYPYTNSGGANPHGGLLLAGSTLYGTTLWGGSGGAGTVFAINTNGTGFTTLHSLTNSDGANPSASLILSGNTLYGIGGNVFAVNTNGSNFTVLMTFPAGLQYDSDNGTETNSVGYDSVGSLLFSGNTLYGTTWSGAIYGSGTVFSISLSPQLTIMHSGTNVIVTWPASFTGFTLEFATNLVPPTVWQTNSTASVVISGQNTVTNPISGTKQFYRLTQ
jgi:uncharacterized repeat protein (TIGR03803 family)